MLIILTLQFKAMFAIATAATEDNLLCKKFRYLIVDFESTKHLCKLRQPSSQMLQSKKSIVSHFLHVFVRVVINEHSHGNCTAQLLSCKVLISVLFSSNEDI